MILVRGKHLGVVRQVHVAVLAALGTGEGVAVVCMEGELSVILLGSGVVHPAVSTKYVVTRGEHQDHGTRVSTDKTGHVSDAAPVQVQGKRITGNRKRH